MSDAVDAPGGGDYSKRWLVLVAVGVAFFQATLSFTIVNIALPTLVEEFETTFAVVQWVVLVYLLTQTTLTLGLGRLGDIVGKKVIFTAGFGIFTLGSVFAGLSPQVGWLLAARVVQGLGAAMTLALGFAIVTEAFPREERGKAIGIIGTVVSLGIISGPMLGGLLIDTLSWRWIFFINVPIGVVGTITAVKLVPSTKPRGGERFDFLGAGVFFVALLSLLLGLTVGQESGFTSRAVVTLFGVAATAFIAFIAIERRVPRPMVDLTLFRDRDLSVNLLTGFITFAAMSGYTLLTPFYLTNVLGYRPREIGLLMVALPISLGIAAPVSGALSDRIGSRPVTVVGLLTLTSGYMFGASVLSIDTAALTFLAVGFVVGLGMGIFQSPNNSAIMGAAPAHRLGTISGVLAINRTTGSITGVAVLGAVWVARTRAQTGTAQPADASAAAQVSGLNDTLTVAAVLLSLAVAVAAWRWWRSAADRVVGKPIPEPYNPHLEPTAPPRLTSGSAASSEGSTIAEEGGHSRRWRCIHP